MGAPRQRSPGNPLSLEKLVYLDGEKAVLYRSYRSLMNPFLGRNFEAMVREVFRVAEQGEGWGVPAGWV